MQGVGTHYRKLEADLISDSNCLHVNSALPQTCNVNFHHATKDFMHNLVRELQISALPCHIAAANLSYFPYLIIAGHDMSFVAINLCFAIGYHTKWRD